MESAGTSKSDIVNPAYVDAPARAQRDAFADVNSDASQIRIENQKWDEEDQGFKITARQRALSRLSAGSP